VFGDPISYFRIRQLLWLILGIFLTAHAQNRHISTSGLISGIADMFSDPYRGVDGNSRYLEYLQVTQSHQYCYKMKAHNVTFYRHNQYYVFILLRSEILPTFLAESHFSILHPHSTSSFWMIALAQIFATR